MTRQGIEPWSPVLKENTLIISLSLYYQSVEYIWSCRLCVHKHVLVALFNNPDHVSFIIEIPDLPLSLLPVPGSIVEIPGSSKVLRRRQLNATKVVNTRSLFLFSRASR